LCSYGEGLVEFEDSGLIQIEPLNCRESNSPAWEYAEELRFVILRSGSCQIEIDGRYEILDPATVALIPPHVFYRLTTRGELADGIRLGLPDELDMVFERRSFFPGVQFMQSSGVFACLRADGQTHRRLMGLLVLLTGYLGDGKVAAYGRLAVIELLILELQQMSRKIQGGLADDSHKEASRSQLIKGVIGYINEHYGEDIHLDSIAKKFWVNPSYLSRQFKEKLGMNITRFIMERRVYVAQQLLLSTNMRVAEVAARIGYKDIPYFNVVFKRVTGVPPGEYRKQRMIDI